MPEPTTTTSPPAQPTLTPDQQKIAAATAKIASASPEKPVIPKVVKNILTPPPAKALEGDFKIDDDDPTLVDEHAKVTIEDDKKTNIEPEKKVEPKVEKKEEKVAVQPAAKVEGDKKTIVTPAKVTPAAPDKRDYTGFTPEQIEALKGTSNNAFQFASKLIKENGELKAKTAPQEFYSHPQGFLLSPEHNQIVQDMQYTDFEASHWKAQLVNARAGKDWRALLGYDAKGNPVYSEPYKATEEAIPDIEQAFHGAINKTNELKGKLTNFQNGFKSKVEADNNLIRTEQKNRFEWHNKPELLETKVDIQGVGEVPIKQIISDFKGLFPAYHQGSPVLDVAADLFAALQIYGAKLRDAEAKVGTEKKLKEEITLAEPAIEGGQLVGAEKNGEGEFNLEGMP